MVWKVEGEVSALPSIERPAAPPGRSAGWTVAVGGLWWLLCHCVVSGETRQQKASV